MKKVIKKGEFQAHLYAKLYPDGLPPPPKPHPHATLASVRGILIANSLANYASIHPDPKGLKEEIPEPLRDLSLGLLARRALAASRYITPDHREFDDVIKFDREGKKLQAYDRELLEKFGLKTRKALYRNAAFVKLALRDGTIKVHTGLWGGIGKWYLDKVPPDTYPDTIDDEEFGAILNRALEASRASSSE